MTNDEMLKATSGRDTDDAKPDLSGLSLAYSPSHLDKMHIDFERFISGYINWPIYRTGHNYHDDRTASAWEVFKYAKGI